MGYILPITHHTYKNYQARMATGDERPFYVTQPQPVSLDKVGEKEKQRKYFAPLEVKKETSNFKRKARNNSEFTEKGKYVNVQV